MLSVSTCVCVYHVHAVFMEARRGCHTSWVWSYGQLGTVLWVLSQTLVLCTGSQCSSLLSHLSSLVLTLQQVSQVAPEKDSRSHPLLEEQHDGVKAQSPPFSSVFPSPWVPHYVVFTVTLNL